MGQAKRLEIGVFVLRKTREKSVSWKIVGILVQKIVLAVNFPTFFQLSGRIACAPTGSALLKIRESIQSLGNLLVVALFHLINLVDVDFHGDRQTRMPEPA